MKRILILAFLFLSLSGFSQNFFWSHTNENVCYGYLYNWFTLDELGGDTIANEGWHVLANSDWNTMVSYVTATGGNKLKVEGTIFWATDLGTNEYLFNARGTGDRNTSGTFEQLKLFCRWWSADESSATGGIIYQVIHSSNVFGTPGSFDKNYGRPVRLVKDATILSHGETGTYTGNDGKIYGTICIGTQELLASDLEETLYIDLSIIPNVTDDIDWSNLITGAWCTYNNSEIYKCK